MSDSTLLLLSDDDLRSIPSMLMVERIELRTDETVLRELLKKDYDNLMVTSNYMKLYGASNVIKAMTTILAMTSSKIHYLSLEEVGTEDQITNFLMSKGIRNIHYINWKTITLEDFQKMAKTNQLGVPDPSKVDEVSEEELNFIKLNLKTLTTEEMPKYMELNRGKLVDLVQNYITTLRYNKKLKRKVNELSDINHFLEDSKMYSDVLADSLKQKLKTSNEEFRVLRQDALKYKDSIVEFNKRIINNGFAPDPIITIDELSPIVVYFKEYEDIGFFNFYESIAYTLRNVYQIYTKSMILEKENRSYFDPYTNRGYSVIADDPRMETIIRSDKMVRYGNPVSAIKTVCNPSMRVEVLLILDKTGSENIMINSNKVIPFYIGSYKSKVQTLNIPEESWISPIEGSWTSIEPLMDRRDQTASEESIYNSLVSNHPLVEYLKTLIMG